MPDNQRYQFMYDTIAKINQKYGVSLQLSTSDPTPGHLLYPRGEADFRMLVGWVDKLQQWKKSADQMYAIESEFYTELAKYDYNRFVQDPAPSLNNSAPRNAFIRSLMMALRQKYGLLTTYYDVCYTMGSAVSDEPSFCITYYEKFHGLHNRLPQSQMKPMQGVVYKSDLAAKDFNTDLAEYDKNPPPAPMQYGSAVGPYSTSSPQLPPQPAAAPPGVPPGPVPQPVPQYAPVPAGLAAPAAQPFGAPAAQPAFTPASFLSAYEIAQSRAEGFRMSPEIGAFFLAGSSIDLSALRGPAKLRSPYVQLGAECLISCVRSGFSGL